MRWVDAKNEVALLPVLEVVPFHFSKRPIPKVQGAREHPAEWGDYFRRAMADAGFSGVVPVREGSFFVAAHSLAGSPLLDQLVREACLDGTKPLALDRIGKLSGGFVLFAEGKPLIEPSCCGDLENLEEWSQLMIHRPPSGTLWVGHPELSFAFEGEHVTLEEQWWEKQPAPDWLVKVRVPADALAAAVASARAELERFREALRSTVRRVLGSPETAETVTGQLIGHGD